MYKFIAALRWGNEDATFRQYANSKDGEGAVITYSFRTEAPDPSLYGEPKVGFRPLTDAEKAEFRRAMNYFSSFANITFVEKADNTAADITIGQHHMTDEDGYAGRLWYTLPTEANGGISGITTPGEVWIKESITQNGYWRQHLINHELGHVLGLKHPFAPFGPNTAVLKGKELNSSAMSYSYDGNYKYLGVLDIIALQSIYGPAKKRMGNNVYTFGKDKLIWDGGGVDTVTAARSKSKVMIDLDDGSWNWLSAKKASILDKNQVYIGNFTTIENAVGSRYSDKIYGNEVNNSLRGGGGNDVLNGRDGNDVLRGEAGNDVLNGGAGDDRIVGSAGNDRLRGNSGVDVLSGGSGSDRFEFYSLDDFGTIDAHDRITDLGKGDKINLRAVDGNSAADGFQKLIFAGNHADDSIFGNHTAGMFYYNTAERELRIDANGDGTADYALGLNVATLKSSYFTL